MPNSTFDFGEIHRPELAKPQNTLDVGELVKAFMARRSADNDAAAHDLARQHLQFQIAQEKTKQAQLAHSQEIAGQSGDLAQSLVEALMQGGHMDSMLRESGLVPTPSIGPAGASRAVATDSGGALAPTSAAQPPALANLPPDLVQRIRTNLARMSPEAKQLFVQHDLPALAGFPGEKGPAPKENKFEHVSTGSADTVFDPSTGLTFDPDSGKWVQSLPRGQTEDQKSQFAQRQAGVLSNRFASRKDVSSLLARAQPLAQAAFTMDRALNSPDPAERRALYSSAIANFMQGADQKAQIRSQMLDYFAHIDKSLGGSWAVLRDKLLKGQLPPDILGAMSTHIRNLAQLSQAQYENMRSAEVKRHPELDNWIPNGDEVFNEDKILRQVGAMNASGAAPAATVPRDGLMPLPVAPPPPR